MNPTTWYIVRAVVCDEYTDSTDAEQSVFSGPYRSKEQAKEVASSIQRRFKDNDIAVIVHQIHRMKINDMVKALKETQ